MKRIAIIGGGASGIVAAIQAAQMLADRGKTAEVVLLERLPRIGKKILATGNGRCNLTNSGVDSRHYQTGDPQALAQVMQGYGAAEILRFFERAGLWCAQREAGRVYPISNQASSVMDVLLDELDRRGVQVICGQQIDAIERQSGGFRLHVNSGRKVHGRSGILAAGGESGACIRHRRSRICARDWSGPQRLYPISRVDAAENGGVSYLKG